MAASEHTGLTLLAKARVRPQRPERGAWPGERVSVLLVELPADLQQQLEEHGLDQAQLAAALEQAIDRETRLARLIERVGVRADVGAVHALLEEALTSLRGGRSVAHPASHFTEAELSELERGGFDVRPLPAAEVDPAARTATRFMELLVTALTVAQAADLLGVDKSRIRQRLHERSLYGIKAGRSWRLPQFQFTDAGPVPGMDVVLRRLPDSLHPVAVWRWMTTPSPDLVLEDEPLSPLDWLRAGGDPGAAVELAAEL